MAKKCETKASKIVEVQHKIEDTNTMEMVTFKANVNVQTTGLDTAEVGKRILKILCVGDYSGAWTKSVYIQDYNTTDGTINENPCNKAIIGVDFFLKTLYEQSGKKIQIQIWVLAEQERYTDMSNLYLKNSDGAVVFWGAMNNSTDSALRWKRYISKGLKQDIPFVLVVDNVFRTPAKWIGEGLVMNSSEEMDNFCWDNGFLAWFEMLERAAGEESVVGQAITALVNEIISRNTSHTSCV